MRIWQAMWILADNNCDKSQLVFITIIANIILIAVGWYLKPAINNARFKAVLALCRRVEVHSIPRSSSWDSFWCNQQNLFYIKLETGMRYQILTFSDSSFVWMHKARVSRLFVKVICYFVIHENKYSKKTGKSFNTKHPLFKYRLSAPLKPFSILQSTIQILAHNLILHQ